MFPVYFWILTSPLGCSYFLAQPALDKLLEETRAAIRKEEEKWKPYEEMRRKVLKDGKPPAKP